MTIKPLSTLLDDIRIQLAAGPDETSIETLLEGLHERGFGVALALFALPMAIPLPKPPGLSTIFGIPMLLFSVQLALGRHVMWFPRFLNRKTLKKERLDPLFRTLTPRVRQIETWLKPRHEWLTRGLPSRLTGLVAGLISLCVISPLPGLNTVTSLGLGIMGLGLVMRDGLAILFGAALALFWATCIITLYVVFGLEGINALRNFW